MSAQPARRRDFPRDPPEPGLSLTHEGFDHEQVRRNTQEIARIQSGDPLKEKERNSMNTLAARIRSTSALTMAIGCLSSVIGFGAVGLDSSVPPIVKRGFTLYQSGGVQPAFDAWRHGGILEDDDKSKVAEREFRTMVRPMGNYRSFEVIEIKEITRSSRMVYVSIEFDRGAIYGGFLVYKTDQDWVVQNMEFNIKPELILPGLTGSKRPLQP